LATLPPSSKEYVVKLNGAITPSSAGIIVALADGLFGRGGLSVSLLSGSGDADAIASAATDDHVIGLASAAGFLRARAEGSPIVAFAASYIVSSVEFYVLPNTRLLTPVRPRRKTDRILSGSGDIDYPPSFHHQKFNRPRQTRDRRERNRADSSFERKDRCADWPWDIEGLALESIKADYRSLSPDSFGIHAMGPVYFAHERALSSPGHLQNILTGIAKGWDAAYSDYGRTISLFAGSIDAKSSLR
jgi:hypothetical protein